ncbi:MAG: hypothetical protein QOE18_196 [Chloroflexota bacterium]|nr:hypothetical protein [Chloroflexota bacterium]
MPPMVGQVILGIIAVLAGCLATTSAVVAARHTGNWLFFICALGATAFVAGVVGQRVFPSPDAVARFGQSSASLSIPGPWDAGVLLPIVGIRVTPVAIGGLLVAAVGLSLVLLFERVPGTVRAPATARASRLEDEDSI